MQKVSEYRGEPTENTYPDHPLWLSKRLFTEQSYMVILVHDFFFTLSLHLKFYHK